MDESKGYENGTVLASYLWELRRGKGLTPEDVDRLVFKTIDGLSKESRFPEFFKALLIADVALFKAVHACAMTDLAAAKGFDLYLSELDCKSFN